MNVPPWIEEENHLPGDLHYTLVGCRKETPSRDRANARQQVEGVITPLQIVALTPPVPSRTRRVCGRRLPAGVRVRKQSRRCGWERVVRSGKRKPTGSPNVVAAMAGTTAHP